VDEISINTGTYDVETVGGVTLKDSFTRAQYGITLEITPTIHWAEDEETGIIDGPNMISLETDVVFDTFVGSPSSLAARPVITRRNVHNEVVIPDGQTLVLGGLRSKHTNDVVESIPFLGEIPCFGKLFSDTAMEENTREMYIFITPRIIADPCEDIEKVKIEQLMKRPGDLPDFLCMVIEAQQAEKDRLFKQTLQILFGRPDDDYYHTQLGCWPDGYYDQFEWVRPCDYPEGEYDGS
jgi:general secretion pathway protein D